MFKKKPKELTEDELIDEEVDKEIPDINLLNFKGYIDLLKTKTDEDIEYESLLSESEREEDLAFKKDIKKLIIKGGCAIFGVLVLIIVGMSLFLKQNSTDVDDVIKTLFKEYYKNNYNKKVTFSSIEKICQKDEEDTQKCDDLVIATTKDNKHLIALNNDLIGDDINQQITKELTEYIDNTLNIKMLTEEIKYSYQDYYYDYNLKLPYIHVLPNKSVEELINSRKVTINYRGIYEGNIDINAYITLLSTFSNDSKIYLIKQNNGMPTKLNILSKNELTEIDIVGNKEIEKGIYTFEYDKNQNSIRTTKLTRFTDSKIDDYKDYYLKNIMKISFDKDNNDPNYPLPGYYIFRFDNDLINTNNLLQVANNNNDQYKEVDINDYSPIITISFGGNTYLIGTEEIIIGSLAKNKSFLCNLGLC